jgi:carboxyl-terminal processing protease
MHRPLLRRALSVASAGLVLFLYLGFHTAGAQTTLPEKTALDVSQSFRLLETTAYIHIDGQRLLDAARTALIQYAHQHGATVTIPQVTDTNDEDGTMDALDDAIVAAATAAHGDVTDYAYAAIAGMAGAFGDRYTQFFTPEEFREFNEALDPQRISGIGVLVEADPTTGYIRLSYVLPRTPADRAGLLSGDLIVSVDGKSTKGFTLDDARNALRGAPGTKVTLGITSDAAAAPHDVTIVRSEVQPPTVIFKMLPERIGYVWVLAFGHDTPDEFDVAMHRLIEQGAQALVLDLRNDGGGYVDSALDISSHFLGDQPILTVEERGDRDETIDADDQETQVAIPTTVLVNADTASASEITAGALQDDGAATLIGTRTFGKGVMQTLTPLPDGGAIKITTAHYLTPRHRDINLRGIDPNLSVAENRDARYGDLAFDAQLRAAVNYLEKKIAVTTR